MTACGGGGGGSPTAGITGTGATPPPPNPNPAPASAVSLGTIAAFGSVFVNGVRFDTSGTEFEIDGEVGSQDDLRVGDVVLVVGTLDSGSTTNGAATSIVFDDAVEGPVQSVDTAANTLVVLGQTVRITASTSFDDSIRLASLAGVAVADVVEVSGLRQSDGSIEATRIEAKPVSNGFETTGLVSGLDTANLRFNINALVVDYSAAMLNDFPAGGIANGNLVEVKGGTTLAAGGMLTATRVEFKTGALSPNAGDRAEIEGFVTRFGDARNFDVSGFPVTTNDQTVFEGGVATDLGLDIKVEAEGNVDANGVLVATKIDIRRSRAIRLMALVDSVDPGSDSFVSLGITIKADALTRVEDKSSQDVEPFSVDQLVAMDYVEVRGVEFPAGSGEILAGLLEREDALAETELQGFVQAVQEPTFTILGVTITTNGGTVFRDAQDIVISSTEFFSQISQPGNHLVKADGTEVGTTEVVASQVEIEIE
jgi:hypothetical protein